MTTNSPQPNKAPSRRTRYVSFKHDEREALRALAEQGLVDKIPNRGCYVQQPDAERIVE